MDWAQKRHKTRGRVGLTLYRFQLLHYIYIYAHIYTHIWFWSWEDKYSAHKLTPITFQQFNFLTKSINIQKARNQWWQHLMYYSIKRKKVISEPLRPMTSSALYILAICIKNNLFWKNFKTLSTTYESWPACQFNDRNTIIWTA